MTDKDASGGLNVARCPTCDQQFVWSVAVPTDRTLQCTNRIKDPNGQSEKRCPHKMPRSDWEYLRAKERKERATP